MTSFFGSLPTPFLLALHPCLYVSVYYKCRLAAILAMFHNKHITVLPDFADFNISLSHGPSVRWLQRILDVCQAYVDSHGIIFNCNKTVCMTFKAKSAKTAVTPLLTLDGQYVKSVNQYKYLGIVLDTELSDDKDIQRQLRYQYCAANKLRVSFSRCSNAVKNVLFRSFCTPMYASQLWCNFRKSCMQRLRVAYNFGCRALYNLPWRASVTVPTRFNVTFLPLRLCCENTRTCFSKDAENLTTSGYML